MFEMPPQSLLTSPAQKTKRTAGGEAGETHFLCRRHDHSPRDSVRRRLGDGQVRRPLPGPGISHHTGAQIDGQAPSARVRSDRLVLRPDPQLNTKILG